MAKLPRFGSAISAVALASVIAGCATPMSRSGSAMNNGNARLALGLRAQMALAAGDFTSAVNLAERGVENSPNDAMIRALLANTYFASGRFVSAEAAYRDTLILAPNQPEIVLKLALVEIAQGKNGEALSLLESARDVVDSADYGLALALAGQPQQAVQVLETAARATDADARVRQNLALAHALSGDWAAARTIAAQDLSPDLVDARVQQWMAFASPARPADQVAALVGIRPAAADPGQPVRLALSGTGPRVAQAQPAMPTPTPVIAAAEPVPVAAPETAPAFAQAVTEPVVAPVAETSVQPAPVAVAEPEAAPQPTASAQSVAAAAAMAPEAPAAYAAMVTNFAPAPKPHVSRAPKKAAPQAAAQRAAGKSKAVVQLGAYSSPQRVSLAWERFTQRYPALRNYSPMRARFDGPHGAVWRLSIRGFETQQEAIARCSQLRSRGGNCFVRSVAGDAPIQFASR